jgi:uncharacterized protein YbjQ (UPF0145 family)
MAINPNWVTTAFELPGFHIVRNFGVVRGIIVRSRSVIGNLAAGIQTIFGGNITVYTSLCEKARSDAFAIMLEHAAERGANAIIGMRYESNEVMAGGDGGAGVWHRRLRRADGLKQESTKQESTAWIKCLSKPPGWPRPLRRVRPLRQRPSVIKLGGSAMEDAHTLAATLADVVALAELGLRPVLVHGGGKPIDRAMAEAGLTRPQNPGAALHRRGDPGRGRARAA